MRDTGGIYGIYSTYWLVCSVCEVYMDPYQDLCIYTKSKFPDNFYAEYQAQF